MKKSNLVSEPEILFKYLNFPVTDIMVSATFVTILILLTFIFLTYRLKLKSFRGFLSESIYDLVMYLGEISLGREAADHINFIGALFFTIFLYNIVGFFPLPMVTTSGSLIYLSNLKSPTSDINVTVALSLISIGYIVYNAIRVKGVVGYMKSFIEPLPFLLPLNIIGEVAKPFSLAMRLFGNIFSGALIMNLSYRYLPIFIPSFFHIYFDLFSGIIQSLIFVTLTSVYLSFAIKE